MEQRVVGKIYGYMKAKVGPLQGAPRRPCASLRQRRWDGQALH